MGFISSFKIIILLSFRNIFLHKIKSLIIGFLMLSGTFLVVLGTSLLNSIEKSMANSITSSVSGHIQIYSKDAKDELKIFGSGFMASDDYGFIPNFKEVKEILKTIPNIDAIVPMGFQISIIMSGNDLDKAISFLRNAIYEKNKEHINSEIYTIKQLCHLLKDEYEHLKNIARDKIKVEEHIKDIEKVLSEEFWDNLEKDPEGTLLFLDTHIAPLLYEGEMSYLRYIGTDLELFSKKFKSFEIVLGEMVPTGKNGFLFNQGFYDRFIKNSLAREFDEIYKEVVSQGKKIANDSVLQSKIKRCSRLYKKVTFQLSPENAIKLETNLRKILPNVNGGLNELVQEFLLVNDENIEERYKFFYDFIAPMIQLYNFKVGDIITLRNYTKSGYIKAKNVKFYGTFRFKGIEKSDIAGAFSLIDLVSFRQLYGLMSKEDLDELQEIKKSVGVKEVQKENIEDTLFSEENNILYEGKEKRFDEFENIKIPKIKDRSEELNEGTFTQEELENGLALSGAIILKEPEKLKETINEIKKVIEEKNLNLKVISWEEASGMVGQFIIVIKIILYIAIFIIFLVAIVIINNSMIMATMERIPEIGTMRAIGAYSSFVLLLFLMETIFLGIFSGGVGALLGALSVILLGNIGIPATSDILVFLFSGPKLYPNVGWLNIVIGFIIVFIVSIISTLYPAYMATKVSPASAMEKRE